MRATRSAGSRAVARVLLEPLRPLMKLTSWRHHELRTNCSPTKLHGREPPLRGYDASTSTLRGVTFLIRIALFWISAAFALAPAFLAQSTASPAASYKAAQAAAGRAAYDRYCSSCHGADLAGIELAPALAGERFAVEWAGKPAGDLFTHVRRMPMPPIGKPGSLPAETYVDLM